MKLFVQGGLMAAGALVLLASVAVPGIAQDKSAVLKQRQDFMKAQGADEKAISQYAKGQGPQAAAQKAADDLVARSSKIPDLFPEGTSATDFPGKTDAKPEIWQNWDKFKGLTVTLHDDEVKLAAAVKSGDVKAVSDQLAATGKDGCGACHTSFRIAKKS